jgi:hypothetical protein
MKKALFFIFLCQLLFGFDIKQFVTCKNVKNLTPIHITNTFTTKDKKVYAFAYFINIHQNQMVDFVWEKNVNGIWKLYADIQLPIYQGKRWRTFSTINIQPYFTGQWRVSIVSNDETIESIDFKIVDANKTK